MDDICHALSMSLTQILHIEISEQLSMLSLEHVLLRGWEDSSRRQECETPVKQTPGADMERQGRRAPEAARVARLQPRHRHDGMAEACHVCQARHAKVRASSHVLIG